MRVLVLQAQPDAPVGHVGDWAAEAGVVLDVALIRDAVAVPDPASYDAVIALGSEASLAQETPAWVQRELAVLQGAVDAEIPVLGICFGAQALAVALGGRIHVLPKPEIAWVEVETDAPELVAPGPWMSWHEDGIELPPVATEIARSATGTQAFVFGPHLGVQFHPEATPEIVAGWLDGDPGLQLDRSVDAAVRSGEDPARAARAAHALLDRFVLRASEF